MKKEFLEDYSAKEFSDQKKLFEKILSGDFKPTDRYPRARVMK